MAQSTVRANFTDQRMLPNVIRGTWQGLQVNLLGIGNQEGHSPAFLAIDENGRTQIISLDEVVIDDQTYVPKTTEELKRLRQRQQQ